VPGPDHGTRNRAYARIVSQQGESLEHAWKRVLPWLSRFPLPDGDRWAGEEVLEPDESSGNDAEPVAWKAVAIRSLILEGAPIVTTADVRDAHVMVDDELLGNASVTVTLSEPGATRFADVTGAWVGQRLAIVVNGRVNSAPVVKSRIGGGKLSISMGAGDRDKQLEDARRLAASLR
jgi:preprotein translocase subunit SecD